MALRSRSRQDGLVAGCFLLLLLGRVSPWKWDSRQVTVERCFLPSDPGRCKALFPRWYHDHYTKTCKTFNYGGCRGNDNNFLSKEECEKTCSVIRKSRESCLLSMDEGVCKASFPRWYYDRYEKACKEFVWTGCGGNDNNFHSEEECAESCHRIKDIPQECRLRFDQGNCRGSYRRYFFNMNTMECHRFLYGGCRGNENRFFTRASCMNYCLPGESISTQRGYSWIPAHVIHGKYL